MLSRVAGRREAAIFAGSRLLLTIPLIIITVFCLVLPPTACIDQFFSSRAPILMLEMTMYIEDMIFLHILLLESTHCFFSNLPTVKQKHACLKQQEVQYNSIMQVQWYQHACKLEQNNNCLLKMTYVPLHTNHSTRAKMVFLYYHHECD